MIICHLAVSINLQLKPVEQSQREHIPVICDSEAKPLVEIIHKLAQL